MKQDGVEYLDSASTTKVRQEVIDAMMPYFDVYYGNASSNHIFGKKAREGVEKAREQVADIINAESEEIYFTSGSTEAINWALKGYVEANQHKGNHLITVKTEHKAVLNTCEYLETKGVEVTYLGVDQNGLISLEELKNSIRDNTILITVMYVNNEIGIIQPIKEIGEIAQDSGVVFFCDATQAVGKIPVDVIEDNIDMLCFSAHKLGGPKGIGALYKREDIQLTPLIHGGGQEKGLRGGTYNTPLIVGLGITCDLARKETELVLTQLKNKRNKIEEYIISRGFGTINFAGVKKAPHILSITLNEDADDFLLKHEKEFVASTGSACNSEILERSHVLKNIFPDDKGKIIRVSI